MTYKHRNNLQEMLENGKLLWVPTAGDCLAGKAQELAGFDAVHVPDSALGYTMGHHATVEETVRMSVNMAEALTIPVTVEFPSAGVDPVEIYEAVRRMALGGVQALSIADETEGMFRDRTPIPFQGKGGVRGPMDLFESGSVAAWGDFSGWGMGNAEPRNPYQDKSRVRGMSPRDLRTSYGKVIDKKTYMEKVHAAVLACEGTDCFVIARVHAYSLEGFDGVVDRVKSARKLGAKMWMATPCHWEEEMRAWYEALGGWAMLPDIVTYPDLVTGVAKETVPMEVYKEIGYNFITCHLAEKAAIYGMEEFSNEIFKSKSTASIDNAVIRGLNPDQVLDAIGMDYRKVLEIERKFASSKEFMNEK